MSKLFWLSDTQWTAIEPLLPHLAGKPRVDDRRVISGILHRYREGVLCQMRMAPHQGVQPVQSPEPGRPVAGTVRGAGRVRRSTEDRHARSNLIRAHHSAVRSADVNIHLSSTA
jgi:transposase